MSIAALALALGKAFLGFAEGRADKDLERFRIETGYRGQELEAKVQLGAQAASVIRTGMAHRMFWVAWSIAAIPTSIWFGWGVLDSAIANGALLPDVAELPPQLERYADAVWQSIFYSGAGVAGVQVLANALRNRS